MKVVAGWTGATLIILATLLTLSCTNLTDADGGSSPTTSSPTTSSATSVPNIPPTIPKVIVYSPEIIPTLSCITISPSEDQNINISDIVWLRAVGTYSDGTKKDITSLATWNSTNDNVARIYVNIVSNPSGGVIGWSAGTANITATIGGVSSPAVSLVVKNRLLYITLTDISLSKSQFQIDVTGFYADGTSSNLTSQASFDSSNPAVISVTRSGLATISSSGEVRIMVYILNTNVSNYEDYMVLPF